ncbi:amino acid ABC transporter permease [Leifsonia poae]|uniref:amino acid ABC transporter permease n=1 Tax=Leifsonia poae TaxID=110933 RepID=UPI001CBE7E3F|nr:amino acid ABC transporter permease [Leifsonia poae]
MTTHFLDGEVAHRGGAPVDRLHHLASLRVRKKSRIASRWVPAVITLVIVGGIGWAFVSAPAMNWPVVAQYLFSPRILTGVMTTLVFTVLTFVLGLAIGVLLAVLRQSGNPVLVVIVEGYIWLFRGTPLLVQLVFWFNLALVFPFIGIRLPALDITIGGATNQLITPFLAALVGLVLHTAAYMAEVVRGGFLAVPPGQTDAAKAIGMTRLEAQWRIVIPQAVRVILPPLGNQFIDILKATAIVSVIGGGDLMTQAQQIYGQNYQVISMLVVASLWYLVLVTAATIGQHFIERSLDRSRSTRSVVSAAKEVAA